jgi:serine protease
MSVVLALGCVALSPLTGVSARTAATQKGCPPARSEAPEPRKGFPNDPLYDLQWNLEQIDAAGAWEKGIKGRGAVIAIIDTGVDVQHPDLRGKIVVPRGLSCETLQDEEGHGTHVAGIAAASTNNGIGVAGVAPNARLLPIPDRLGTRAEHVRRAVDNGADVINMSFISSPAMVDPLNTEFTESLRYAREQGVVLVAGAGNFYLPFCSYPAADPLVLCVAGTDRRELPSHFSHLPVKTEMLAVRAPAGVGTVGGCDVGGTEDIWSTLLPGSNFESCQKRPGYDPIAGTSMASPHVAGLAALLAGEGLSSDEIIECITSTARNPRTGVRGNYDPVYGYGIIDAAKAAEDCT